MLTNDVSLDLKVLCHKAGITQAKFAENAGKSAPYINRTFHNGTAILPAFIDALDKNGYDVHITYVKRDDPAGDLN